MKTYFNKINQTYMTEIEMNNFLLSLEPISQDKLQIIKNGIILVSNNEYNLSKLYNIKTPETNPETNQPWAPFSTEREAWISNQLEINGYLEKGGKGQLARDFSVQIVAIKGIVGLTRDKYQFLFNQQIGDSIRAIITGDNTKAILHLNTASHIYNMGSGDNNVQALNDLLKHIIRYEMELTSIANGGQVDITPLDRADWEKGLSIVKGTKSTPSWEYIELHKILGIEEIIIDVKAFTDEIENRFHIIESGNSPHTLSSEMPVAAGGTQIQTK